MTPVTFRPTLEADYPDICALFSSPEEMQLIHPSGSFPMTVAQLQAIARVRTELTTVVLGDRPIGFANLYNFTPKKFAFIGNVVIHPLHRSSGLGKQLISYMIDRCFKTHGLPEVRISVLNYNSRALLLYRSLGFLPYEVEETSGLEGDRIAFIHLRRLRPAGMG